MYTHPIKHVFCCFCFGECLNIPVVLLRTSATCTGTWRFASQEGKVPPEAVQLQRTMEELSGDFGTAQFAVDVFDLGNFIVRYGKLPFVLDILQ